MNYICAARLLTMLQLRYVPNKTNADKIRIQPIKIDRLSYKENSTIKINVKLFFTAFNLRVNI